MSAHSREAPAPVLSVVSPVHCEAPGLAAFLDRLEGVLRPLLLPYEIVLVDDGSTDDTWERMREESARRPELRCLRLSRNFGKEAALVAGLEAARGDAAVILDSDLQHPPELIPGMVAIWRRGEADIVEAEKTVRQKESFLSRQFARLYYSLFARVVRLDLRGASDFKLLDRKVLEAWKNMPERRVFFRGMSSWLGFRRAAVPFPPADRQSGISKWSYAARFMLALDSLSAYTAKPLFLILLMGAFFCAFALLMGSEALWMKFHGKAVTGFTTVILLILITGAAVLGSICLLSLYVRQIFHEVKQRPRYLVSEYLGYAENGAGQPENRAPRTKGRRPLAPLSSVECSKPCPGAPPPRFWNGPAGTGARRPFPPARRKKNRTSPRPRGLSAILFYGKKRG